MQYEFKVIELTNRSKDLEKALNQFGKLGFRLANFLLIEEHLQLVLEKEIEE